MIERQRRPSTCLTARLSASRIGVFHRAPNPSGLPLLDPGRHGAAPFTAPSN